MPMSPKELRAAIEAILFVSGQPVALDELVEAFPDEGREAVEQQLAELEQTLAEHFGGFHLERAAGGFRFATNPALDPFLRKFFSKQGEGRLSMAALETLSIIAYRQPVTLPEISEIRGVNSSGVIRTLLERRLIRIAGRKNVVGSPFLYRTTREFLTHFGLNGIQDLPRLEEFAEVLGENVNDEMLEMGEIQTDAAGATEAGTEPESSAAEMPQDHSQEDGELAFADHSVEHDPLETDLPTTDDDDRDASSTEEELESGS
jgi:segregation and condensation protein B